MTKEDSEPTVRFPFEPYASQRDIMDKVREALVHSQNAILESPTGSGKTLALLCATLAWHEAELEKIAASKKAAKLNVAPTKDANETLKKSKYFHDENTEEALQISQPSTNTAAAAGTAVTSYKNIVANRNSLAGKKVFDVAKIQSRLQRRLSGNAKDTPGDHECGGEDDDDDFAEPKRTFRASQSLATSTTKRTQSHISSITPETSDAVPPSSKSTHATITNMYRPKIYYGTRTHKQLAQVVSELRATTYKPRMAILGSHCKAALETDSCKYFDRVRYLKGKHAGTHGVEDPIWDIEDLVKMGKRTKACPYFASKLIAAEADVIFCPYNYLVDPELREKMDISVKGNVFILDEGHNVEDVSRQSGSLEMQQAELADLHDSLVALSSRDDVESDIQTGAKLLAHMITTLLKWCKNYQGSFSTKDMQREVQMWTGPEILALLESFAITEAVFDEFENALKSVKAFFREQEALGVAITDRFVGADILTGLIRILGNIVKENGLHCTDYHLALIRKFVDGQQVSIGFWCLNPGLTFRSLSSEARSVIVASGTLTPMNSFSSELCTHFGVQLEASHVIAKESAWVGVLGVGPTSGLGLSGTFSNVDKFEYQDQVGETLLRVCQIIPDGVLCFVPSYSFLDKLFRRWRNTGLENRLSNLKTVYQEPRSVVDFEKVMKRYMENVGSNDREKRGAIIFGVYRGKLSEGIDFSDASARAVVAVGIPFPNTRDIQVELKKSYNAKYCVSKGLLNGPMWYECQAYRAYNQALGRCIRHRNDWGAILLLDQRLHSPNSQKNLSKWIRERVVPYQQFDTMENSLRAFVQTKASGGDCH